MKVTPSPIPDVLSIEPQVFGDARGYFFESWQRDRFAAAGLPGEFVQDNQSGSVQWVLRGLHYQLRRPQGKLVRVIHGEVFDVAVDLRRSSPTFGRWFGELLSADNRRMLWVPPGFAHGFLVTSERAEFVYKCTEFYDPADERALRWDDPTVAVAWPLPQGVKPAVSAKDAAARSFADVEYFA
jgi:dTDP-4-dehydrorhamnose 3,5-epimerase